MSELFVSVLNMSISASWIVLAVLLVRLLLKRAPKWIALLLWAVVACRLILPFAMESELSLIPSVQTIDPAIAENSVPQIYTGFASVNNSINPVIEETFAPAPGASVNPVQIWTDAGAAIWIFGILVMAVYGTVSYLRIQRKIGTAVLLRENIFQSEMVVSPFVLGLLRPKIYLPLHMSAQDMLHVIAHEQAHICRKDHWVKPIGFAILTLHWFNPLMWLSYILLSRDIELACDERVIKKLDNSQRADYSQALLNCSIGRRMLASCPLAFGEVSVKDRVKSVLQYKKPAFWILLVSAVSVTALAVCFLTNPASARLENIEGLTLGEQADKTVAVWSSNGEAYHSLGAIDHALLQELMELRISREEISHSRDENRSRSNTLVLQTRQDTQPAFASYLKGLYIHFNSDFTSVWVNDAVKPTLSYKVIDPQRAKEVYKRIAVQAPEAQLPPLLTNSTDIQSLKARFPMYFDLGSFKGLEIYVWQMAENSYSCGVLPGRNRNYTQEELWSLHQNPASLEEMRAIIASYIASGDITEIDVTIIPIIMPHSSYAYTIDEAYTQKLRELFWAAGEESEPIKTIEGFRTYHQMSDGTWKYGDHTYKYRLEISGRMPMADVDTTYVYLSNLKSISFERAMWASGLSSHMGAYFSAEEAVLVDLWSGDAPEQTERPK